MKLVCKNINRQREGDVTLIPEHSEDMWNAYNLISKGNWVRASTVRKIQTESLTGSTTSYRTRTILTIAVENIDFDTQGFKLRLKGRTVEENPDVKLGSYHTLELELNRKFSLRKEEWDSVTLERLEMACDVTQNCDLAAVIMQEGLANVCLITSNMTLVRATVNMNIPRKKSGDVHQHEKALNKFYENTMQTLLRHINFDVVKCVLVASPGFVRDQFFKYMFQQARLNDNKLLLNNKEKFMLVHSSSGFKQSLQEVLQNPLVIKRIADTKATGEVKALDYFYATLQSEPAKAFYGKKHVEIANESQAIKMLLISDSLFRSQDEKVRKEYVKIVDSVREMGGVVKIFSSMHISGERLDQLTGIAAILRFPMHDLDNDEDDSETEDESA